MRLSKPGLTGEASGWRSSATGTLSSEEDAEDSALELMFDVVDGEGQQ